MRSSKSIALSIYQLSLARNDGAIFRAVPPLTLTPANLDGKAGGAPQLGQPGAARLGQLLGLGNVTVQGIQDGCVRYAINGHSIGANALGQFILNNPAYV